MKAKARFFAVGALLASALAACSRSAPLPEATAPGEYRTWERTIDEVLTTPIPGHGTMQRRIYVNATGETPSIATENGRVVYDYPDGTIIIKEMFMADADVATANPAMLTVMAKAPDDPRAQGGWLWLMRGWNDAAYTLVTSDYCVACHRTANEVNRIGRGNPDREFRDGVFYPYTASETTPQPSVEYGATP